MNRKRIIHTLDKEFKNWVKSIDDTVVRDLVNKNAFITGGAIVSLLENKAPNDLDIYFKDFKTALAVTKYYVREWNDNHAKHQATIEIGEDETHLKVYIRSAGIAEEKSTNKKDESEYRPVFLSSNAITLSDGIQLITRFIGSPKEVHKNFDFIHCTNSYEPYTRTLTMPSEALESFIMKELRYVGSRYPIASILRTRKFINRGYKINAGQYLKMVFQLQQFDLTDPLVLADQLNGVDLYYMREIIDTIESDKINEPNLKIDSSYLVSVVEKIFDKDMSYDSRLDNEDGSIDSLLNDNGGDQ